MENFDLGNFQITKNISKEASFFLKTDIKRTKNLKKLKKN
jgi:hypothetical protein